jgi:hypothetical protein
MVNGIRLPALVYLDAEAQHKVGKFCPSSLYGPVPHVLTQGDREGYEGFPRKAIKIARSYVRC